MPEDLTYVLAAEIRRRLTAVRMSGRELARLTGLASNTVAVKLRGEAPLDVRELAAIAEALGVSSANLIAHAEAELAHPSE